MKVELDFDLDKEDLRALWCMLANARAGQKKALEDGNQKLFAYYSSALGGYVDILGLAAPEELAPDGSETQKP